jgi:hypothetical protein
MKLEFKKRLFKTIAILVGGFVVLFLFRFVYGYTTGLSEVQEEYISDFFSDVTNLKRNYASSSYKYSPSNFEGQKAETDAGAAQGEVSVNQKYEKIATIKAKSKKFSSDAKLLRDKIKKSNSIMRRTKDARAIDLFMF